MKEGSSLCETHTRGNLWELKEGENRQRDRQYRPWPSSGLALREGSTRLFSHRPHLRLCWDHPAGTWQGLKGTEARSPETIVSHPSSASLSGAGEEKVSPPKAHFPWVPLKDTLGLEVLVRRSLPSATRPCTMGTNRLRNESCQPKTKKPKEGFKKTSHTASQLFSLVLTFPEARDQASADHKGFKKVTSCKVCAHKQIQKHLVQDHH